MRNLHIVFRSVACCASDEGDRRDGDAFVYDRHTIFFGDFLTRRYEVVCKSGNLVVNVLAENVESAVRTVHKVYSHGDGPYVEVLFFYHFVGLDDLMDIYHNYCFGIKNTNSETKSCSCQESDSVHHVEDFLLLAFHLHADALSKFA